MLRRMLRPTPTGARAPRTALLFGSGGQRCFDYVGSFRADEVLQPLLVIMASSTLRRGADHVAGQRSPSQGQGLRRGPYCRL